MIPESNVIELQCVVVSRDGWFLEEMSEPPKWTNTQTHDTAKRFSLAAAAEFIRGFRHSLGMGITMQPTI